MPNPILITIYDRTKEQYDLSVAAYNSAVAQDIPVELWVIDNGSTWLETVEWLDGLKNIVLFREPVNRSPIAVGNSVLEHIFKAHEYVLTIPNDVILPPNAYRKLLERPEQMVAANMDGTNPPPSMEEIHRIHGDLHMAIMLIRKSAYDTLVSGYGYFMDTRYWNYCSDCDMKLRLVETGISTAQTDLMVWHYGGASHRLAPEGQREITGTDKDYGVFLGRWGFMIGSPNYDAIIAKLSK